MHNPRGSNNRLNEQNNNRDNANRLFDSQNNNRGGYNVGDAQAVRRGIFTRPVAFPTLIRPCPGPAASHAFIGRR